MSMKRIPFRLHSDGIYVQSVRVHHCSRSFSYHPPSYVDVVRRQRVLHTKQPCPGNIPAHVHLPPGTIPPFTKSSTSANTGFRSQWLEEGLGSNNLNNFTIAPAFARHSRNKLYPRNFKIDDRAADTCKSVRERNTTFVNDSLYTWLHTHCMNCWSTNRQLFLRVWTSIWCRGRFYIGRT